MLLVVLFLFVVEDFCRMGLGVSCFVVVVVTVVLGEFVGVIIVCLFS